MCYKEVQVIYLEYNFKQDLKAVREILMMTQAELAETLGVMQITISRSEQGENFCEFYVIKQGK